MDIIAAHRQGLIEQLDEEVAGLAGCGRDHAQRAMVLHHLYDHSRGNHIWALTEARRTLRIAAGLETLRRRLGGWGWIASRREETRVALESFAEALGEAARLRMIAAYRVYRMTATPALREEAEAILDPALAALLSQCHAARRADGSWSPEGQLALAEQCERLADAAVDRADLDTAWAAIEATHLKRATKRLLGDKRLARLAAKDQRRGTMRVERELRFDAALPASFQANPAQHFYALQHQLRERRTQQWRQACDREADADELAA